jgi:hypothetical protein
VQYQRGRDTSDELTEVRTVLSRAETAIQLLERQQHRAGTRAPDWVTQARHFYGLSADGCWEADPDLADMLDALRETVRRLDKYRRTGTTRRR